MEIKVSKYQRQKDVIKLIVESKPNCDKMKMIGEISLSTMCPILVVAHFMGELYGFTPELLEYMDILKKFYGVTCLS